MHMKVELFDNIQLIMQGGSFLIQWARYRRQGVVQRPHLVVGVLPGHPPHFDFVLEMAVLAALIYTIPDLASQDSLTQLIKNHLQKNPFHTLISAQYLGRLVTLHSQWHSHDRHSSRNKRREFLLHILSSTVQLSNLTVRHESMGYPRMVQYISNVVGEQSRKELKAKIENWWSFGRWMQGVNSTVKALCLEWIGRHKFKEESNGFHQQSSIILKEWFDQICHFLRESSDINEQIVLGVSSELKELLVLCDFKSKKVMKPILLTLKKQLLQLTHEPELFALLFATLQSAAETVEVTLFDCHDLLQHESFYGCLYYLQRRDNLDHFTAFHKFMRQNSIMNVLTLNRTLNLTMAGPVRKIINIIQAIEKKNSHIICQFNLRPISTAKAVLTHYLKHSGIFITQKKFGKVSRITRQLKLTIPDPLQFMLIKKEFWEDKFGYEVLGLALWVITEGYCREVQYCCKEHSDKVIADFIKKLKITIFVFLFSLKYPVKMLQFMPYEGDIAGQFVLVPILPSLLLDSGYFFSEFRRDELAFVKKKDFGGQGEIFAWASQLMTVKNIRFILHNYKGYEFYGTVLDTLSPSNFKNYAEIIVTALTSALSSMGINSSTSEDDLHRMLNQISMETRQEMCGLLAKASSFGDKTGALAEQYRGLILESIE